MLVLNDQTRGSDVLMYVTTAINADAQQALCVTVEADFGTPEHKAIDIIIRPEQVEWLRELLAHDKE